MGNKQQNGRLKSTMSIITLNINGLNIPVKGSRLFNWIEKQCQTKGCYDRHILYKNTEKWKVKGWGKISCKEYS